MVRKQNNWSHDPLDTTSRPCSGTPIPQFENLCLHLSASPDLREEPEQPDRIWRLHLHCCYVTNTTEATRLVSAFHAVNQRTHLSARPLVKEPCSHWSKPSAQSQRLVSLGDGVMWAFPLIKAEACQWYWPPRSPDSLKTWTDKAEAEGEAEQDWSSYKNISIYR